jgi:hypothetical protein
MPYKSEAQRRYFNANREKLEAEGVDVDEWNDSSKGKKLPKKKASDVLEKAAVNPQQQARQKLRAGRYPGLYDSVGQLMYQYPQYNWGQHVPPGHGVGLSNLNEVAKPFQGFSGFAKNLNPFSSSADAAKRDAISQYLQGKHPTVKLPKGVKPWRNYTHRKGSPVQEIDWEGGKVLPPSRVTYPADTDAVLPPSYPAYSAHPAFKPQQPQKPRPTRPSALGGTMTQDGYGYWNRTPSKPKPLPQTKINNTGNLSLGREMGKGAADVLDTALQAISAPVTAARDAEKERQEDEAKLQKAVDRNVRERMARQLAKQRVPKIGADVSTINNQNRHLEGVVKGKTMNFDREKLAGLAGKLKGRGICVPVPKPKGITISKKTITVAKPKKKKEKKSTDLLCHPQRLGIAKLAAVKLVRRNMEKRANRRALLTALAGSGLGAVIQGLLNAKSTRGHGAQFAQMTEHGDNPISWASALSSGFAPENVLTGAGVGGALGGAYGLATPDDEEKNAAEKRADIKAKISELLKNKAITGGLIGAGTGLAAGGLAEMFLPADEEESRLKLPLSAGVLGASAGSLAGAINQGGFGWNHDLKDLLSKPAPRINKDAGRDHWPAVPPVVKQD